MKDKEEEEGTKEEIFLEWQCILNEKLKSKELKFKEKVNDCLEEPRKEFSIELSRC